MSYDINLKHLEYFIKVARLGSINKAARCSMFPSPILERSFMTWRRHWGAALKQEPSGRVADSRGK